METNRWKILLLLLAGNLLPPLDFFIVNAALPSIQLELNVSAVILQLVISLYAAAYASSLIAGGRLGDVYGRARIFLWGLIGFGFASAFCGLSTSANFLLAGRVLQGVSAAILAPQALALIHAIFPDSEKKTALSLYGATFGLAAVAGQVLGGFIVSGNFFELGWRAIFLVNLPFIAGILICGHRILNSTEKGIPRSLDLTGVVLSVAVLGSMIIPLTNGRDQGWPLSAIAELTATVILLATLFRHEANLARRGGEPLIDPYALRIRGFALGLIAILLFYAIAPLFLTLTIFLQKVMAKSPADAGLAFAPFGLGFLLGPLCTPWLGRRTNRPVASLGMLLESGGLLLLKLTCLSALGDGRYVAALPVALFGIGLGQGLALPSLARMTLSKVGPEYSGMASGLISASLQVSAALSMALIGGVFYEVLGTDESAPSIGMALGAALDCMTISLAAGSLLALKLQRLQSLSVG